MTQKQKALSQLAHLALNAVSEAPNEEQRRVNLIIATALDGSLPDLCSLARQHAAFLAQTQIHKDKLQKHLQLVARNADSLTTSH